jgi:uncharacterized membrane protein YphA (DoxX/SURF4 family)
MNIALWVVAGLLAAAFLAAGLMKITGKREQMVERMAWVGDFPQSQVKLIGAIFVMPGRIRPSAATGLVIVMVLAAVMHLRRGDGAKAIVPNIVLGLLAAFVAWGRFGPYPL